MKEKKWLAPLAKCIALGLLLFFSAVFALLLTQDLVHLRLFAEHLFLIMGGYLAVSALLLGIASLKLISRIHFLFSGASILYWIFLFLLPLEVLGSFLADYIRCILSANALVLISLMIGNFFYMKYIADELNNGKWNAGFRLLEDIDHRPGNENEFMDWISRYCQRNALDLEIIRYGIPAEIRMDGLTYRVQITEYASMAGGVIPAVEFVRIEKQGKEL